MVTRWLAAFTCLCAAVVWSDEPPPLQRSHLFVAGEGGYEIYRIPALAVSARGTLLAACEARRSARSDWGEIDLLLRRSADDGATWSPPRRLGTLPKDVEKNEVAVAQKLGEPGKFTMNNPVLISARDGTFHALYCVEYARCFHLRSTDEGATFSEPVEITPTFVKFREHYAWKVLATGPGHAIELKNGRLVVPIWLSTGTGGHAHRPSAVATIYSDNGGERWHAGEIIVQHSDAIPNPSETVLVELSDGRVMANIRTEAKEGRRLVSVSGDGAARWSKPTFDEALAEPVCMASLLRLANTNALAFVNPDHAGSRRRENLAVQFSYDDGRTWGGKRVLDPKFAAYSDLAGLSDGTLCCLYESGGPQGRAYGALTLLRWKLTTPASQPRK